MRLIPWATHAVDRVSERRIVLRRAGTPANQ